MILTRGSEEVRLRNDDFVEYDGAVAQVVQLGRAVTAKALVAILLIFEVGFCRIQLRSYQRCGFTLYLSRLRGPKNFFEEPLLCSNYVQYN
jgi:hypothetical protein